jgi:release factor glutamine methyltransferase
VATEPAWTIGGLLDWTARFLAQKGVESPRLDAEVLLAHALDCRRIQLYTRYDETATGEARQRYRDLIRQRLEGCPVAYLVGRKEFFSLAFEVNRDVLIPRPESEFVVLESLALARGMEAPRVLDLGAGSGNLAVAVAHQLPKAHVTTVDLSEAALAVAARNAARHQVQDRVRLLHGDLFAPLGPGERFDFVLSNPPYIPTADVAALAPGVRDYEPHLALDGGPDGFAVLRRIAEQTPRHLEPGGHLIVEIGAPQEATARQLVQAQPGFTLAPTVHDYSGHPRVVRARWRG